MTRCVPARSHQFLVRGTPLRSMGGVWMAAGKDPLAQARFGNRRRVYLDA